MNVGELPNRRQIVGRRLDDELEFGRCLVKLPQFEQRAAQRDTGRQIRRVLNEAGPGHVDCVFQLTGAPMLFGQLRKRNRRRVPLDPASKVFNPRMVSHCD